MDTSLPILITGYAGFVGKNLVAELKNQGYENLLLFERDDTPETLARYASQALSLIHI